MSTVVQVLIIALVALVTILVLLWRNRAPKVEEKSTPVTETMECLRCGTVRVTTGTIKGLTRTIDKRTYKLPADRNEQSGEWLTCRTIGHKWPQIPELSMFGDERRQP